MGAYYFGGPNIFMTPPRKQTRSRLFPPLVFAFGLLAGGGIQLILPSRIVPPHLAIPLREFGFFIIASASVLALWSLKSMRQVGTTPNPMRPTTALSISGPYRFSRNPMYLGFVGISLGVALSANALWPLLSLPFIVVSIHHGVILHEERYLEARFGLPYQIFKCRVRRWL